MALPTPPPYTNPIPNNPFYSPLTYVTNPSYPLIVGTGLSINPVTAVISSTGGGGSAVTGVFAGAGISVSGNTGNVTVNNAGVLRLTSGPGINLSAATGNITISSTGTGTVTSVTAGTGLSGGTITTTGTIALANTAVLPGIYTNPTLIIDAQGRVTTASNGTAIGSISVTAPLTSTGGVTPTLGINAGTTTACGAVQLSDSVSSTSSALAATPLAVKTAYDAAIAAIPKSCITALGSLITGTGASTPVALSVGADGTVLTACSASATGLCWGPAAVGGIPCSTVTGKGALVTGTAASTPVGLTVGADGQALFACNAASSGLCWAAIPQACPMTYGTVYGKTNFANTALGQLAGQAIQNLAGCAVTAIGYCAAVALGAGTNASTAVGINALAASTCSSYVTAIGDRSMINAGNTCENVAVGTLALRSVTGSYNTVVGSVAGYGIVAGSSNVFIGRNAACDNTSGNCNVVIGANTTTSSLTVSCELVIGYGAGQNWLTGDSTKAIKPGAGIIDNTNSCGTAGQVLTSNGSNAVCWVTLPANGFVWQQLAPLTTTSTATTTALSLPVASVRGATVNISVSNSTTGNYHNDSWMVIHDGATANAQLASPGAHIGPAPYSLSATVSGANLLIQVSSVAASATKYVGIYQTFEV